MKNLSIFSILASSILSAASYSYAAGLPVKPLADARAELKPEAYSAAERELVAKQALFMIENLFVHREVKIKDFGAQVDPVPRLKDMVRRAASLSDADFHAAMQKIFLDLHDHHTNYSAPMPLLCSYVLAPLYFTDVYDGGSLKVIVKGQTTPLKDVAQEAAKAKPGDELVAVNDQPIAGVLEELKKLSGGANDDAMVMGAIMNLTVLPLSEVPLPDQDTVKYTLKNSAGTYTINTKYFVAVNIQSCVDEVQGGNGRSGRPGRGVTTSDFTTGENPRVRDYKNLVLPKKIAPFADEEGKLPVGTFYTIDTPAGKLAKFDLETFMPEKQESADDVIHQVKALLEKNQSTADALIIDMRGNGGGSIVLAEGLTQLFTPNAVEAMPVRFLPNDLNLQMFLHSNQGNENGWSQDTREAISSQAKYTKPRTITSTDAANRYGQVWFKPVVVLTDAGCYSACDLFAAAMQDHAAATIIGTHDNTGAGGANVMEYDIFRQVFDSADATKNPFEKLPGHQGMRVSWRQTIRVGKNAGKLIENTGVKSDIVVRYVTEDVVGGESRALMREVHKAIEKIIPRYKSSITLASGLMMPNGSAAAWKEIVKGVDKLEVVQGDKVVQSYAVNAQGETVEISLPEIKGEWTDAPFHVVGKAADVTQFRVIRDVHWRGAMLDASRGLKEDFASGLKYWHAVQSEGPAGEGWQVKGQALRVGKGPKYSPRVVTQVFVPIDTIGKRVISLDLAMNMETEEGMDFVNIIVRDPETGNEEYLASVSGTLDIAPTRKVMIPVNGAKQLEIVFEFMSDENWHMTGPAITKLNVQTLTTAGLRIASALDIVLGGSGN
jgi:C-terminal processing protease CtpA/Prc